MIHGTAAKVSVLLMVVGLPYRPKLAGNGGLKRGWPFLPSSDFQQRGFFAADVGAKAVKACSWKLKSLPRMLSPSRPAARASSSACFKAFVDLEDLAVDVVVAGLDAHRVGGNGHAFDHDVRVVGQDVAVLAGARLAFVAVAHQVLLPRERAA
jgi:hypothetical protein